MRAKSFLKIKRDIEQLLNYKPVKIQEKKTRVIPVFQRVNDDVPYLTEEKIEDAYLNDDISLKTKKLLEWLTIKENLEVAENVYINNKNKFEELSFLIENQKTNFTSFICNLIKKHEQAISHRE